MGGDGYGFVLEREKGDLYSIGEISFAYGGWLEFGIENLFLLTVRLWGAANGGMVVRLEYLDKFY